LAARLEPVLTGLGLPFEVILVNDGSADRSWLAIQKLRDAHPWIAGINLSRNYGQHAALLCGIRAAQGDAIVTMDDDLQNPPEEIPRLLDTLSGGADVVYGYSAEQQHGFWRGLASRAVKLALSQAMGAPAAERSGTFRAFHRTLTRAFENHHSPFVSIDVLLSWATSHFDSVEVRNDARATGASQYTVRKLVVHAINMLTGFSTVPLRLASLLGFAAALFGVVVLAYVGIVLLIYGRAVPGFAFLASVVAIFSGVQLFSLGIIGEYLARMHFRMMDRPPYVVAEHLQARDSHDH